MLAKNIIFNILLIFFLNVILRIPGVLQELPPNTFCDEDLIINYAYKNYLKSKPYYYGVSQINYYLASIPAYVYEYFFEQKLTEENFIILSRFIGPVF